jgi:hypothetical protein
MLQTEKVRATGGHSLQEFTPHATQAVRQALQAGALVPKKKYIYTYIYIYKWWNFGTI